LEQRLTLRATANLARTEASVLQLADRAQALRAGFLALPRLPQDNGAVPEPVVCEALDAV
jgi:hypothetical protein